ncbi:exo-beta-N-acetylmuramidase NamZ domain-containing protein [Flagellimonas sp.]|uniref:exo-beta-N-acetylmuramidase NamZ family protein n=1 Tax=Flagellimonas sp. TaxID=2058762 RepID=UPI003B5229B0
MKVLSGLDVLTRDKSLQQQYKGKVALLCHNASVDSTYTHATIRFKEMFGPRFIKLFGPQHGFSTDVQDNMVETDHTIHPYFQIPVYSLYSETRIPTDEMLEDIDHIFVDLQDVGCRIYTYIYTLTLLLEKCADKDIQVIVLDRPNPINGEDMEGNLVEADFVSFVGLHPLPIRHALTIGEVGLMHQKLWAKKKAKLEVIQMKHWDRAMYFEDTGLPWFLPSPNIARPESTITFPATVFLEGTQLSEGRGTSQPLEIVGHPKIEPYSLYDNQISKSIKASKLQGFELRPITFLPTFQKHGNTVCGGFQIHVTDRKTFKPWRVGQFVIRELYHVLGEDFKWKQPPYEYNYDQNPIDVINGTDKLRKWVERNDSVAALDAFEHLEEYKKSFEAIKLY